MKNTFKIKQLILAISLLSMSNLIQPVFAAGNEVISDFDLIKNDTGQTVIKFSPDTKFRYYVAATGNNLTIDIKDANFSDEITGVISAYNELDGNIKIVRVENIDNETSKITIELEKLTDFKFSISAPKGVISPYGFNYDSKAIKNRKVNQPVSEKKNKIEKVENNCVVKNIQKKPDPEKASVKLITENDNNKKVVNQKPEETVVNKPKLDQVEKVVSIPESAEVIVKIRNKNADKIIRLDEDSITVPDNFDINSEKNQKETQEAINPDMDTNEEELISQYEKYSAENQHTEPQKPAYKAIPNDDLLKRLTSNSNDEKN
ncbi:MAG: AMIN domain-containing protein, partial [Cyanobacteriota bacterium]